MSSGYMTTKTRIRPLTGQVLIEVLPEDRKSAGGIELPDYTLSAEYQQERAHKPTPPKPVQGVVCEIGPWPKTSGGLSVLPEFGIGARVLVGFHAGVKMQRNIGEKFRMVRYDQVLAVLS